MDMVSYNVKAIIASCKTAMGFLMGLQLRNVELILLKRAY